LLIEVRLFATLRRHAPSGSEAGVFSVRIPAGSTITDLLKTINVDPAEVHLFMVNGVSVNRERILSEGDRVGLFPPVGGG
jgi:molybdopterin synthase sulfur carrier subunit